MLMRSPNAGCHAEAVEERELHYTQAEPLIAWRLFRVRSASNGPMLTSPLFHDPDHIPLPSAEAVARCHHRHRAPAPGCRCGLYAAVDGTLDSLPGYLLDSAHDDAPWVYAQVACSGRLFVDLRGLRVERIVLRVLALPRAAWPNAQHTKDIARRRTRRYGVPVADDSAIPRWITANARPQGAPTADATLDLTMLK